MAPSSAGQSRAAPRLLITRPGPQGRIRRQSRRLAAVSQPTVGEGVAPRVTFTNPNGNVLEPVREDVWAASRPFIWNSIDVGGRMTAIKVADGSLWVHSPVQLDKVLADALAEIGPVKHIVSPNFEHLKYAQQWIDAYPEAVSYACPGLTEAHPEISFTDTIGVDNAGPGTWPKEIAVTHLSHEVNPFTGKPFFNEVLFCHEPSRVLLTTDFFWNYPKEGTAVGTRAWKFGMDVVYAPFYFNLMIRDRAAYNRTMVRILGQDWDMIIPCHGDIVDTDAKGVLRRFAGC